MTKIYNISFLYAIKNEMQQNISDVSHSIENKGLLEISRRLNLLDTSGKYCNENLPGESPSNSH